METVEATKILFYGRPQPLGGLSNEDELARVCPNKFKHKNPWSDYAMKLFYSGGNISNWKWKSNDLAEQKRQLNCLEGVLSTFGLDHEDKEAVAGWMLSEMLIEVPKHVPGKED